MKTKIYVVLLVGLFLTNHQISAQNIAFRSHLAYPAIPDYEKTANIGGYVDSLGNEYALVGTRWGLSIVNVTNPDSIFEVTAVVGPNSLWREVKTWMGYAYVTTEGGNNGLQIIDLRGLPSLPLPTKYWKPHIVDNINSVAINDSLRTIHALHIDNGYAYLYGHNISNKGALFVNLADPWNPVYAGMYNVNYIHDGYVRDNKLYGGHINQGWFSVIDVADKSNPVVLQTHNTPNNYTHNTWLSDNSEVLFTTDETNNSFLAAYDITNLGNIELLDEIQINPGSNAMVHNTHILNDYAITSWYKEGVVVTDVSRPRNLVNIGHYDTSPLSGGLSEGCWGVYPFLPSGNIVASDMQEGLFVLTPTYKRGCYLEGIVTDFGTGMTLNNADITVSSTPGTIYTDIAGTYATGVADSGTYSVTFSKAGYFPQTISVNLDNGIVDSLNVQLISQTPYSFGGQVIDSVTLNPIAGSKVIIKNNYFEFDTTTDASGNYTLNNFYAGNYDMIYGKWGYQSECISGQNFVAATPDLVLKLGKGIYDDFALDNGWTVGGDAFTGSWVRGEPVETELNFQLANPGEDVWYDCSGIAFITGNGGGAAGDDDVDASVGDPDNRGYTELTSPVFDLTSYTNPYVDYSRWFFNGGGTGSPNDSMKIILNNGITSSVIETVTANSQQSSSWVFSSLKVSDYITPTANMQLSVYIADDAPGHVVEGGFDGFFVSEGFFQSNHSDAPKEVHIVAYPNPFNDEINIDIKGLNGELKDSRLILTDMTGRVLEKYTVNNTFTTLSLNKELKSGIYFLKLTNNNQPIKTIKIVKVK